VLFAISFTARPGKEAELERVLTNQAVTEHAAAHMGARLDALFVQGNRFTRIYEFPDGTGDLAEVRARVLAAQQSPEFHDLLRVAAPLLQDPFDPEDPTTVAAFVQRHKLQLLVEARPPPMLPPVAEPLKAAFTRVARSA